MIYLYFKNLARQPELHSLVSRLKNDGAMELTRCDASFFDGLKWYLRFGNGFKLDYLVWRARRFGREDIQLAYFILCFFLEILLSLIGVRFFLARVLEGKKPESSVDNFLLTSTEFIPLEVRRFAKKKNVRIIRYLTSWDHPTKLSDVDINDTFLVWSAELKADLIKSGVQEEKIYITGSLLLNYSLLIGRKYMTGYEEKKYRALFLGTTGDARKIKQELLVVKHIISVRELGRCVLRPYPKLETEYRNVASEIGLSIYVQECSATGDNDTLHQKEQLYSLAAQCSEVIHFGTTAGAELKLCGMDVEYYTLPKRRFSLPIGIQNQHHHKKYFQKDRLDLLLDAEPLDLHDVEDQIISFLKPHYDPTVKLCAAD